MDSFSMYAQAEEVERDPSEDEVLEEMHGQQQKSLCEILAEANEKEIDPDI